MNEYTVLCDDGTEITVYANSSQDAEDFAAARSQGCRGESLERSIQAQPHERMGGWLLRFCLTEAET